MAEDGRCIARSPLGHSAVWPFLLGGWHGSIPTPAGRLYPASVLAETCTSSPIPQKGFMFSASTLDLGRSASRGWFALLNSLGWLRSVQTVITLTSISLLISLSMTSLSLSSARGFGTVRWLCWFCSCWPCWRRGASCASSWRRGWQLG